MTFSEVFYNQLVSTYTSYPVYYGSAEGANPKSYYHVLRKVADNERPVTLCQEQGEAGNMLLQISTYGSQSPGDVETKADACKDAARAISGVIGTGLNKYRIWQNNTTGVNIISDGSNEYYVWGCIFEVTLWWEKV
jgi:hypothetical protein